MANRTNRELGEYWLKPVKQLIDWQFLHSLWWELIAKFCFRKHGPTREVLIMDGDFFFFYWLCTSYSIFVIRIQVEIEVLLKLMRQNCPSIIFANKEPGIGLLWVRAWVHRGPHFCMLEYLPILFYYPVDIFFTILTPSGHTLMNVPMALTAHTWLKPWPLIPSYIRS